MMICNPETGTGYSGSFDMTEVWLGTLYKTGAAIARTGETPWNHRVSGVGGGHDDAEFAERGRSQVAWAENDARSPFKRQVGGSILVEVQS